MDKNQSNQIKKVISNHMSSEMWDAIIYPFPNGCTVEVWERISNFTLHFIMLRLKLIHINKMGYMNELNTSLDNENCVLLEDNSVLVYRQPIHHVFSCSI